MFLPSALTLSCWHEVTCFQSSPPDWTTATLLASVPQSTLNTQSPMCPKCCSTSFSLRKCKQLSKIWCQNIYAYLRDRGCCVWLHPVYSSTSNVMRSRLVHTLSSWTLRLRSFQMMILRGPPSAAVSPSDWSAAFNTTHTLTQTSVTQTHSSNNNNTTQSIALQCSSLPCSAARHST